MDPIRHYIDGQEFILDRTTKQILRSNMPYQWHHDFEELAGTVYPDAPAIGVPWCKKIVGNATIGLGTVYAGAAVLTLTNAPEKQEATLHRGDTLNVNAAANPIIWEAKLLAGVAPSAGVQAVCGLAGAWADDPSTNGWFAWVKRTSAGWYVQSYDGITLRSEEISIGAATALVIRCEIYATRNPISLEGCNIRWFMNGTPVGLTAPFVTDAVFELMQPYVSIYKASGTGIGVLEIDSFAIHGYRV